MSSDKGHVFVVPGDLTELACDAWLLPTDSTMTIEHHWLEAVPRLASLKGGPAEEALGSGTYAVPAPHWPSDEPLPVLAAVPFYGVQRGFGELEDRLRTSLEVAAAAAKARSGRSPRRLVAMPAFGTGGGGGGDIRGDLLRGAMRVAAQVADAGGVDIALVLRRPADLAVAQRIRRDKAFWPLAQEVQDHARRLANLADQGLLVPFLGAGVSKAAGLPLWGELVHQLLDGVDFPTEQVESFAKLSVLDQAMLLRRMYDEQRSGDFNKTVAHLTDGPRYGIASITLAALPTREAVTLNYDTLYERACRALNQPLTVLPDEPVLDAGRWLLKLHGTVTDPTTIVLTREDYLGYGRGRDALSALAKAMLMTRHLLFVGFGFADDHFHELMHDVRQVFPSRGRGPKLGTALMVSDDPLRQKLWQDEVELVALEPGATTEEQARRLEIFLDMLLAFAGRGSEYFLRNSYEPLLTEEEQRLRGRLLDFIDKTTSAERQTPAWKALEGALDGLGYEGPREFRLG